jgi:two-component system, OmpR family, alkaline phosphatase synthesis response regulator PhoP
MTMGFEEQASGHKVLLADDEKEILDLLAMTLEDDERYQVLLASDGERALELCKAERPELVFLDVQMPKMDGISVCEQIRKDPSISDTKVIMLTALAQEAEIDRALIAGADDYMTKPFSPTALHQKLLEALGIEEAAA